MLLIFVPAWTKIGMNFRATAIFVTDGADEIPILGETSPTVKGGVTYVWSNCTDCTRDRLNTNDRRLAGMHQTDNGGTQDVLTVTLSQPGTYTICLALGEANSTQGYQRVDVLDDVTPLFSVIDADGTADNHFDDATGVDRTNVTWPTDHVCQTGQVVASTSLVVKLGATTAQANASTLAHLYIELEVAPGAGGIIGTTTNFSGGMQ